MNYGSGGAGTSLHLAAAVFAFRAGIDMVHVPYRGGAPVAADLVSGKMQVSFSPMVEVLQQVRAGKLRALGVTTARRSALLPDVPAISEVIPGYEVALWNGIMGPAGLPAPVVARLGSEMVSHRRQPGNAGASRASRARIPWAARPRNSPLSSPPSSRNGRSWCASRAPPSTKRRQNRRYHVSDDRVEGTAGHPHLKYPSSRPRPDRAERRDLALHHKPLIVERRSLRSALRAPVETTELSCRAQWRWQDDAFSGHRLSWAIGKSCLRTEPQ